MFASIAQWQALFQAIFAVMLADDMIRAISDSKARQRLQIDAAMNAMEKRIWLNPCPDSWVIRPAV